MNKYLLLTAKEYRSWFDTCEGWMWEATSWRIYSDGSFRITVTFKPGWMMKTSRKKLRRQSGIIPQAQFDVLLGQLNMENWGEPDRIDLVLDGSMWEIRQYSPEGTIIGSSGTVNFIDGRDRPLDRILNCLPEPDEALFNNPVKPESYRIKQMKI